jgi:hypothetical protein
MIRIGRLSSFAQVLEFQERVIDCQGIVLSIPDSHSLNTVLKPWRRGI